MDEILEILTQDARTEAKEIARMTNQTEAAVQKKIKKYEKDGTILKYRTILNPELVKDAKSSVRALIEVGITPQKNVGFDAIAERIYKFPEVASCYLVSGSYDLLVVVEGETIQTVADFVATKLSSMEQVRSTATHFLLKKYKEYGEILKQKKTTRRLNISY